MKKILSANIKLKNYLSMHDIFTLHQFAKSYSGKIYILSGGQLVNPNHLTKLVSFFLLHKNDITIVVEGHQVQAILIKIQEWLKTKTKHLKARQPSLDLLH